MTLPTLATLIAATTYLALAGLHAYWACGGLWPGTDRDSLHRHVIGGPQGMRGPGPIATWVVIAILVGAAGTVLGGAGIVEFPIARAWLRNAALAGAVVLFLRGVEGYFDTALRPATRGSPFARLNVWLYSPICFALALCTATAVL